MFAAVVLLSAACSTAKPAETAPQTAAAERPLRCDPSKDAAECDVEGMKFENSVGRPRSRDAAALHYQAACEAGFGPGCTHLAGLHFEAGRLEVAHDLYQRACEASDAEGCANLGFMESKAGNTEAALKLYSTACDSGSMTACANLADAHQSGRAGTVDHDRARELFSRSCAGGNPSACIRWGWALAQGCAADTCATPVSTEKEAAELTQSACEAKADPTVCVTHAVHLESGSLVAKDGKGARAGYAKACESGNAWGCERLGTALSRGVGGPKDPAAAAGAYEKGCEANFAAACSALGAMHLAGDGVQRNEPKGAELVKRACELHEARACNTIRLLDL